MEPGSARPVSPLVEAAQLAPEGEVVVVVGVVVVGVVVVGVVVVGVVVVVVVVGEVVVVVVDVEL